MKRVRLSGFAGLLCSALAIALAGSAVAYFSTNGTGNAAAAVSKLTAPVISTASPAAGGAVTLTWGAVTAPGEGSVTYYVTRDGGEPSGNCPDQEGPTTVTTCVDGSVPIGEHTYVVTAVWHTLETSSSAKTAKVTIGVVTSFTVSASATSIVAGGSSNLTITAKDEKGSTVTTYTGSHSLVFSGANAAPGGTKPTATNSSGTATNFGTATAITFTSGVSTVNNTTRNGQVKLYQAGTASIVATEGSITTPSPPAIAVSSTTASKFVLTAASATPTAGVLDELTTTAQDTYGNTATSYTGAHSLVFSGASASPSGTNPTVSDSSGADVVFGAATTLEFTAGVAKASEAGGGGMKLYKSGSTSVKATEGSITTPTAVTVTVAAGTATKLVLSSSTTTPVAATGFNLTTTAQDAYGNTATSYAGTKNITFSGASTSPSGTLPTVVNAAGTAVNFGTAAALTFTSGVATPASSKNGFTKLNKVETANVTATDGTISAAALPLTVSAGAAARVALLEVKVSAGSIGSPCLFTCTITSLGNSGTVKAKAGIADSVGNIVPNLAAKTVTVTATAGTTVTGSPLTTAATGSAISATEFTATAPASGSFSHTITAASTGYTSATATVTK